MLFLGMCMHISCKCEILQILIRYANQVRPLTLLFRILTKQRPLTCATLPKSWSIVVVVPRDAVHSAPPPTASVVVGA